MYSSEMAYVVTEACIRCKYQDCVEVCPVECFHAGKNMLVINPEVCIDCGVCVPECPVEAIIPDTHPEAEKWVELNRLHSASDSPEQWPSIFEKGSVPEDADQFRDVPNKFSKYFTTDPDPTLSDSQ